MTPQNPDVAPQLVAAFRSALTSRVASEARGPADKSPLSDDLYVARPEEEAIISAFIGSRSDVVGVIVGIRGSGKTTLIKKVLADLDSDRFPCFYVDLQQLLLETPSRSWPDILDLELSGRIRERFVGPDDFEPYIPELLWHSPWRHQYFEATAKLTALYHKTAAESSESFTRLNPTPESWVTRSYHTPTLRNYLASIADQLSFPQWAWLVGRTKSGSAIERLIVAIDHVSDVAVSEHLPIFEAVARLRDSSLNYCQFLVAVDREDPRLSQDSPTARTSPFLKLAEIPLEKAHVASALRELLDRRLSLFMQRVPQGARDEARTVAAVSHALGDLYRRDGFLAQIANYSIGDAADLHVRFLLHVAQALPLPVLLDLPPHSQQRVLSSAFRGWLGSGVNALSSSFLNPVAQVIMYREGASHVLHGDLGDLILLWTTTSRHLRTPSDLGSLTTALAPFAIGAEDVRRQVHSLWSSRLYGVSGILGIRQAGAIASPDDIRLSAELIPTSCASALLGEILPSFFYIARQIWDAARPLYYTAFEVAQVEAGEFYADTSVVVHARAYLRFMQDAKAAQFAHLKLLERSWSAHYADRVRDTSSDLSGDPWSSFLAYFSYAGADAHTYMARGDDWRHRRLQLQRMAESASTFLNSLLSDPRALIGAEGEDLRSSARSIEALRAELERDLPWAGRV